MFIESVSCSSSDSDDTDHVDIQSPDRPTAKTAKVCRPADVMLMEASIYSSYMAHCESMCSRAQQNDSLASANHSHSKTAKTVMWTISL